MLGSVSNLLIDRSVPVLTRQDVVVRQSQISTGYWTTYNIWPENITPTHPSYGSSRFNGNLDLMEMHPAFPGSPMENTLEGRCRARGVDEGFQSLLSLACML